MNDRTEWLQWRRNGIGASDVPAILGESPWATPYQVWLDKVHNLETEQTVAMELGLLLEDWVLDRYETTTGRTINARQVRCEHPNYPHHRATLDGVVDGLETVEAKVVSAPAWIEPPAYYVTQVQWQMWTGVLNHATLAVLHDRRGVELYEIDRDDDHIARCVEAVETFWHDHVITGEPPEPTGKDLPAVREQYADTEPGKVIEVDDRIGAILAQYRAAKINANEAQDYTDALQAKLITLIRDAEQVVGRDGTPVVTYKPTMTFDADLAALDFRDLAESCVKVDGPKLRKALGKDAEPYLSPGSRRLIVK